MLCYMYNLLVYFQMLSKLTSTGTSTTSGTITGASEPLLVSRSVDLGDGANSQPLTRDRSVSRATDTDAALVGLGTGQKGTSGYV